jgi:hypothetical protein
MSFKHFTLLDKTACRKSSPSLAQNLGIAIRLSLTAERAQCLYPQPRNGLCPGTAWYSTSVVSWYTVSTLFLSKMTSSSLPVEISRPYSTADCSSYPTYSTLRARPYYMHMHPSVHASRPEVRGDVVFTCFVHLDREKMDSGRG